MTKSNLFSIISHKSVIEESDSKDLIPTRMLNLSVFFQHTMNALSSDESYCKQPVLQIASICLNILKLLLETNANSMASVHLHLNSFLLILSHKLTQGAAFLQTNGKSDSHYRSCSQSCLYRHKASPGCSAMQFVECS